MLDWMSQNFFSILVAAVVGGAMASIVLWTLAKAAIELYVELRDGYSLLIMVAICASVAILFYVFFAFFYVQGPPIRYSHSYSYATPTRASSFTIATTLFIFCYIVSSITFAAFQQFGADLLAGLQRERGEWVRYTYYVLIIMTNSPVIMLLFWGLSKAGLLIGEVGKWMHALITGERAKPERVQKLQEVIQEGEWTLN